MRSSFAEQSQRSEARSRGRVNGPSRIELKRQIIELREEKHNHDQLTSKLNSLLHKYRLLEDEQMRSRNTFEAKQHESSEELNSILQTSAELKKRSDEVEREVAVLRQAFESGRLRLQGLETQMKENTVLRGAKQDSEAKEREDIDEFKRRVSTAEDEKKLLERKLEQAEEELIELEAQVSLQESSQKYSSQRVSETLMDVKNLQNMISGLEASLHRYEELLCNRMNELEDLQEKLHLQEQEACKYAEDLGQQNLLIEELDDLIQTAEQRIEVGQEKSAELEDLKNRTIEQKNSFDEEIIEQGRKLKQLDYEMEVSDKEAKELETKIELFLDLQRKMFDAAEGFENLNQSLFQQIINCDDLEKESSLCLLKADEARDLLIEI